jgi:hypothetical protein
MKIENGRRPQAAPRRIFLSDKTIVTFSVRIVNATTKNDRRQP